MAVTSLNDLNKDFADRCVQVIGLSIENPETAAEGVRTFLRDSKTDYKMGWISEELAKEIAGDKAIVPQTLVITDEGLIIKRFRGYSPNKNIELLRESVEQAFINPPAKQ